MNDLHPNTIALMAWSDRMMDKTGLCGAVLTEALSVYCDEWGEDSPSENALATARSFETDIAPLIDVIKRGKEWCCHPSWGGCIHHCEMWKEGKLDTLLEKP